MPYIAKSERPQYAQLIAEISKLIPEDRSKRAGHLNYLFTSIVYAVYGKEMRYADHNEVVGLLSCVQQEFYRRATAPYEDKKITEEGDV